MVSEAVYRDIGLAQVPRILGLCNRNPASETFGCGDRYYWHYRLLDLPNARFQETAWLLTFLYTNPLDTRYYQNKAVLKWVEGMLGFWLSRRNSDGSVNEVYPFERSFCATSFSTLAMTETILLSKPHLDAAIPKLEKTARWLMASENPAVSNQQAACLVALHNLGVLLGDKTIQQAAEIRKRVLLKAQHADGYFPEYGGMDIGYLSITLSLLALYADKTGDADVLSAGGKAADFLEPRIQDDGLYDNTQTSRQTQYLYPAGLAFFRPNLLARLEKGIRENRVLTPQWLDDRYCIALATDYLWTAKHLNERPNTGKTAASGVSSCG